MKRRTTYLLMALVIGLSAGAAVGQELLEGTVLFEYWFGGGINNLMENLLAHPDFPDNPHGGALMAQMDHPDWADMDYWGARGRAYLTPPADGEYTFWIAADDDCDLFLSADEDPANAVMIAQLVGWCNYQDYAGTSGDRGDNTISDPVPLVAGQRYYIEMVFCDGTGGGHGSIAWSGADVGPDPVTIPSDVFSLDPAWIPTVILQAKNPSPPDGEVDVTAALFEWEAGLGAVAHDVYMGQNPEPDANDFRGQQGFTMYFHQEPLEPGAVYYWRIDEVDAAGNVTTGNVWSFTVMPLEAHAPSPYDGALWRKVDTTFSWTAGQNAVSHRLYGGTDEALVAAADDSVFLGEQAETTANVGELEPETRYFWRIDEVDAADNVVPGPVWTFTTIDPAGGAHAQYWAKMFQSEPFAGAADVVTTVPEVNFDWGSGSEPGINSPDPCIPVDQFSCRWTTWLNVPVTGTYRLYDATDDGGRLFLNGEPIAGNWVDRGTTEDASDELELQAGERYVLVMEQYENGGGATAFLRWEGPGIPKEIIPQGALQIPGAIEPNPADGAEDVAQWLIASWLPAIGATERDFYIGTNPDAVLAADPTTPGIYKGRLAETQLALSDLDWGRTYYWRVDEVSGDQVWPGTLWSFTTAADYIPVVTSPLVVDYNNTVEPYITEAAKMLDVAQDWTTNGMDSLLLQITGSQFKVMQTADGVQMRAAGADIYLTTDEFRFLYKTLTGDGSITAVVESVENTHEWAKGGVMIRASLEPVEVMTHMIATPTNRVEAMQRPVAGADTSAEATAVDSTPLPQWVRITRAGNTFTNEYSADGETWEALATFELEMPEEVYIGLAATSHVAGTLGLSEFSNIATTGAVSGDWQVIDMGVAQGGNDPAPLYVAVEDTAGNVATVDHPANPDVVLNTETTPWKVQLDELGGVDLKSIAGISIGVGDGTPDGTGTVTLEDARVVDGFSMNLNNANPTPHATVWQLTDHVIAVGETFTLKLRVRVSKGVIRDRNSIKATLYYDDNGKRVPLASKSWWAADGKLERSVSVDTDGKPEAGGKRLGVEFTNLMENWLQIDKVSVTGK